MLVAQTVSQSAKKSVISKPLQTLLGYRTPVRKKLSSEYTLYCICGLRFCEIALDFTVCQQRPSSVLGAVALFSYDKHNCDIQWLLCKAMIIKAIKKIYYVAGHASSFRNVLSRLYIHKLTWVWDHLLSNTEEGKEDCLGESARWWDTVTMNRSFMAVSCGLRNFRNAKLCETFRTACVDPKRAKLVPHWLLVRNYLPLICRLAVTAKAFGSPQHVCACRHQAQSRWQAYFYHLSCKPIQACLLIEV